MMPDSHLLETPAAAWAHFYRMMRWTGELALGMIAFTWVLLFHEFGMVSIHLYIASALGIGFMVMLLGALMSLVFLSHRTGHDDTIIDKAEDDTWQ
ncbi:hypothetical protein [Novosphingobium sp.]|uniref:hypothetical protein n=1 Tax=Novosphingobium sp. TaxID=1874826 RepID=UPI003B5174EF